MADIGINCRATAGYVTDGANETYCVVDFYPTTRGGATFGWDAGGPDLRDRNSSNDRRLAGCNFSSTTSNYLRVDVTNEDKVVHAAFGDASFSSNANFLLRDGTTTFQTIADSSIAANSFVDAAGTEHTAANWPSNEVGVSRTFVNGHLRVQVNGTGNERLAHVRVVTASSPPPPPPTTSPAAMLLMSV